MGPKRPHAQYIHLERINPVTIEGTDQIVDAVGTNAIQTDPQRHRVATPRETLANAAPSAQQRAHLVLCLS